MSTFDLTTLRAKTRNPRKISAADKAALAKSIAEFSKMLSLRPIVYDPVTMEVLGGNQRLVALKEAGYKEVPAAWVRSADELTEEEKRRFVVQDNAQAGEWDTELLLADYAVEELKDWGVDLPEFDVTEAAPEEESEPGLPPAEPESMLGDLYELNGHRLVCGDSTDADVVAKVLNGAKPHLMVTDPPYGVEYAGKTKDALTIENDAMDADGTHELWRDTLSAIWPFLRDGGVIYATVPPGPLHIGFAEAMLDLEALRQIMVWDKGRMVFGHSDYHYGHEPILYGWKPGAAHYFVNDRTKTTVFRFAKPTKNSLHPTMKPVELWEEFIHNSSNPSDGVYEPFSGSGTTIIACERTDRTAYAIELSPAYIDVAVKRWVKYMAENDRPFNVKRNGKDITTEAWIKP